MITKLRHFLAFLASRDLFDPSSTQPTGPLESGKRGYIEEFVVLPFPLKLGCAIFFIFSPTQGG